MRRVDDLLTGGMLEASTRYSRSGWSVLIDFHGDFTLPPDTESDRS